MSVRVKSRCDHLFKVLFVGDSAVGKSCFILKYCDNTFKESFISTIGVDFKIKNIDVQGKKVRLQIWDTAGQERFATITAPYYRRAHATFLLYDITRRESFEHVSRWLRQIRENAPEDVCTVLIGNKLDMDKLRQVSTEQGQRLARENDMLFFETSAKTGENMEKIFMEVCKILVDRNQVPEPMKQENSSKAYTLSLPFSSGLSNSISTESKKVYGGCC